MWSSVMLLQVRAGRAWRRYLAKPTLACTSRWPCKASGWLIVQAKREAEIQETAVTAQPRPVEKPRQVEKVPSRGNLSKRPTPTIPRREQDDDLITINRLQTERVVFAQPTRASPLPDETDQLLSQPQPIVVTPQPQPQPIVVTAQPQPIVVTQPTRSSPAPVETDQLLEPHHPNVVIATPQSFDV